MNKRQIQALLAYLGYYTGPIDGILGGGSVTAIRAFQRAEALTQDGAAGELTQAALKAAVADDRFKVDSTETNQITTGSSSDNFWGEIQFFSRSEFKCQCGGRFCNGYPAEPKEALIRAAEKVRSHFGVPVTVSSGVRCTTHNRNVGGVANSKHLTGDAMDFCVKGVPASKVENFLATLPEIRYHYNIQNSSYVHMNI